ncbi:DUF4942 domain-containing protein [Halocynthiibacter sp.]|uniref:DUF4942 domain-containing protein n=1 Tax=Halocynthiibacter sp. TaxID=1979210 RepID=UPI003C586EAA
MNQHSDFPRIGKSDHSEHQVPALRRSLREIVEEYNQKLEGIPAAIEEYKRAETSIKSAGSIGGKYGGCVFSTEPRLYERDVIAALLKAAWKHVYDGLNIKAVASAKDRSNLSLKLENPDPFTIENIRALFGDFLLSPRFHVLKGLAECFCDLDPAYKSHSKVKIGVQGLPKRIIVTSAFGWSARGKERVRDTLNALRTYRGEARYEYGEFADLMEEAEKYGEAKFCGGVIRGFLNGNAHLIFDKQGLLDINRGLAEFYGEVLPDAPSEAEAKKPGTEVAADLAYYPTPKKVIDKVVTALELHGGECILEPSCGDGQMMDALAIWHKSKDRYGFPDQLNVTGVECHAGRATEARSKGHHVMVANFLEVAPDARFDAILMNPPFCGQHYKKHLDHAVEFLKPGGRLVCILPATAHYDHGNTIGRWTDLPVGSFASSGTNIPTGYCTFRKPG